MSVILFYSPFNQRSRDTESLMIAFRQQGHRVISLSQAEGFQIHPFLNTHGIETRSFVLTPPKSIFYYIRHILFLIRFASNEKVDVVYSHLESANFVAAIAQYFMKAKVFLCRHHIDEAVLYGFDKTLYYRLTYRLARKVIVVSDRAKRYMIEHEGTEPDKIVHINLAYDFNLYETPSEEEVVRIREETACDVLLLTVSRLTRYKRAELSVHVLKKLLENGVNARLIILGKGEEELPIRKLIEELGLERCCTLAGYVNNVAAYMKAADFLLHPSLLESSCVSVKEAALMGLPVVVCKDVGDFNDFLIHGENAFLADQRNFVEDSVNIVRTHYRNKDRLLQITTRLRESVINIFDVGKVISQYKELNERC